MSPPAMNTDARFADIIENLADPKDYLREIVGNFVRHSFDKERSSLTTGVSGTGPYLRALRRFDLSQILPLDFNQRLRNN
jgi:hypothetical protein